MIECDFAIVGGGIAGASAAYGLMAAGARKVVLLERENQLAYHTTGRSAAWYVETYGNSAVRRLTTASGPFFRDPPPGFSDHGLIAPRPVLHIAGPGQGGRIDALLRAAGPLAGRLQRIDAAQAVAAFPQLRAARIDAALCEPDCFDLDVHALHQGFLHAARGFGLHILTEADLTGLERAGGGWRLATRAGPVKARVVVNAAGAWADEVAALAGARPQGLEPRRRTIVLLRTSAAVAAGAPLVIDAAEQFYFKPDHGLILASPADETLSPPCDAQPEDLDVALAIDRVTQAADFPGLAIVRKWAGLRSFAPGRSPVFGYDAQAPDFFWAAGQGGFGIQTAPAAARLIGALALARALPADLARMGIEARDYAPR